MSNEIVGTAMSMLIPILTVSVSLGALVVWIVVSHRSRMHEAECRHKERMAAIEKGLELPPEPVLQQAPRSRYLLRGLIWLGVGLPMTFGVVGALRNISWGSGWIAIGVGAAYLIFYFVEGRKAGPRSEESASGGHQTP